MLTEQIYIHWNAWSPAKRRKLLAHRPAAQNAASYIDNLLATAQGDIKPYLPGLKCELRLITEEMEVWGDGYGLDPEWIAAKAVQRALESLLSPYRGEDLALAVALCSLLGYLDMNEAKSNS